MSLIAATGTPAGQVTVTVLLLWPWRNVTEALLAGPGATESTRYMIAGVQEMRTARSPSQVATTSPPVAVNVEVGVGVGVADGAGDGVGVAVWADGEALGVGSTSFASL